MESTFKKQFKIFGPLVHLTCSLVITLMRSRSMPSVFEHIGNCSLVFSDILGSMRLRKWQGGNFWKNLNSGIQGDEVLNIGFLDNVDWNCSFQVLIYCMKAFEGNRRYYWVWFLLCGVYSGWGIVVTLLIPLHVCLYVHLEIFVWFQMIFLVI